MEGVIKLKRLGEDELLRIQRGTDTGYITLTQFSPLPKTDCEEEEGGFTELE